MSERSTIWKLNDNCSHAWHSVPPETMKIGGQQLIRAFRERMRKQLRVPPSADDHPANEDLFAGTLMDARTVGMTHP